MTPLADLLALQPKYDRPVPRYTSYPPVPAWRKDVGPAEHGAALAALAQQPASPMAVYAHLPFCRTRCLYCGCHVVPTSRAEKVDRYLDQLEAEIHLVTGRLGLGRRVQALHLGGGTPNFLSADQLRRLGGMLHLAFDLSAATELSVEADPREVSPDQLGALAALGFRRISFGVQDTEPAVQTAIGRVQPLPVVAEAVAEARGVGFRGVNIDLMYGLPHQTPASLDRTIDAVLALGPDRLACFGYAHVPWMQKHQTAINEAFLPDAPARASLFHRVVERLEDAGYAWVGLDHFARPDDPLAIAERERRLHRNFMGYTTRHIADMVSLGASAISEVGGRFAQNEGRLPAYAAAIAEGRLPIARGHELTADDRLRRAAILELLCNRRVAQALAWGELAEGYERIRETADDGLVAITGDGLEVTRLGRFFLRTLASAFDAHLPTGEAARRMSRAL
ncbi:MAG: oxygen-independent coproporphyrinogen III oxidase [Gemmatimonadales bacterium]|nr:oxygen-independent coproporphyrinogen III oxidase [Gemmatimonadales bacterium]